MRWRVKKVCELLHEKAQDYGESFRRHGLPGLVPRLWDKIARYAQLKADNRTAKFERMEDSVVDLLGYCCVAWSLMLRTYQKILEKNINPLVLMKQNKSEKSGKNCESG